MDIEKKLFKTSNKLIWDKDCATATIIDNELDPIHCNFNNDNCVGINTNDYSYITLSIENLYKLIDMIRQSHRIYNQK